MELFFENSSRFVGHIASSNRAIPNTGVSAKKAPSHALMPTHEATEKNRLRGAQNERLRDNQHSKHIQVNKSDKVKQSFEPGSRATDMSDLHPRKQPSQITSIDEGM
jgi:hypothetical protein